MAGVVRILSRSCLLKQAFPLVSRRSNMGTKRTAYDEMKQYWVKNQQLSRPLSPVLSIYGYHLTMVMSIGNRITAVILQKTLVCGSCLMLLLPMDFKSVIGKIRDWKIHPAVISTVKYILAIPFVYHSLCSIRHLVWDVGVGYQGPTVIKGGYSILIATAVLSTALVFGVKPSML